MNWLLNIFDSIKWKIEDAVWAIQDKYTLWKELRVCDKELEAIEEVKTKKKKTKKKAKSK